MKRLLVISLVMLCLLPLTAQEVEWSVDVNAVLNNREGGNEATPDQTFIFTRVTPQVGASMDKGHHAVMAGVTWYQPMNDGLSCYKVLPALYYSYRGKGVGAKFGVIPNELGTWVPRYLLSDSLNYVSPNIKGAVIEVRKKHFDLYSWLDWRQMQTDHRREAFDATAMFSWHTSDKRWSARGVIRYNHLAKSKRPADGEGVVDNFIFSPTLNYAGTWPGWSVDVSLGMLLSSDRDRSADNRWHTPVGFSGSVAARHKWLRLAETVYAGQRQMPLYEKYGSLLYLGDQYYHNKFYSRTTLTAIVFSKPYLNLEAQLSFHATDKTTAFWQQVAMRFYLDKRLWKKKGKTGDRLAPQF